MEKDPARVFSVSVNLCGHPKESEVVFENQKYRWDDYGHNSIVKTGFRLNNKTEKHSTIGSGGGMKTKWREKISRKKKRDCSSDIGGAFFWYLPQIQVNRQIRKEQEEAVEMYVREKKKKRTKRKNEKSEEVQEQEPGSTDQNLFRTIDFAGLRSKIEKICAWLWIPGCALDVPVAHGQDNAYYLTHDAFCRERIYGSIFCTV